MATNPQEFDFDIGDVTGKKGDTGNGISGIELLSTSGLQKTYRINMTNETHFDFVVTDGNGINGASFDADTNELTITFDNGTSFTTPSLKGAPGNPGDNGYSPAVTIETITGGHRITITDKTHPTGQSFDVLDGASDAGNVSYDESATYQAGSVGAELQNQSRQISDVEENKIPELNNALEDLSDIKPFIVLSELGKKELFSVKNGDKIRIITADGSPFTVGGARFFKEDGTFTTYSLVGYAPNLRFRDVTADADFVAIAEVNSTAQNIIVINYSSVYLTETFYSVKPFLRNGSVGNPGNTNAVGCLEIIPTKNATGAYIYISEAPQPDYHYSVVMTTSSISNGTTPINATYVIAENTYDYDVGSQVKYIPFDDGSVGYAFSIFQVNSVGNYISIRTGTIQAEVLYTYKDEKILELKNDIYTLAKENSQITFTELNTKSAFFAKSGDEILVESLSYSALTPGAIRFYRNDGTYTQYSLAGYDATKYYRRFILVPNGEFYFAELTRGTAQTIRVTNITNPANTDIAKFNEEIEYIVNACANYGTNVFGVRNAGKRFTMLVTTDVHNSQDRLYAAVDYLNYMDCIDLGVCLGDITVSHFNDSDGSWYRDIIHESDKNWLTVIGNHDCGNNKSTTQSATEVQTVEKWITPNVDIMGTISRPSGKGYYYKDITDHNIRIICLNCYQHPDDVSGGEFVVSREEMSFLNDQIEWFVSTLNNTPSDYAVIILVHNALGLITPDNNIHFQNTNNVPHGYLVFENMIPTIIDAWIKGQTVSKTFSSGNQNIPNIIVNADFSDRGTGAFIGYIAGHEHKDFVGHYNDFPEQKIMIFSATANDLYNNGGDDLPRSRGTKAEDAITVVSVDYPNVSIVRIGSDMSRFLIKREPSFFQSNQ